MRTLKIPELEEIVKNQKQVRREWTDEEMQILQAYYGRIPAQKIAKYLNRSVHSVFCKATVMGLKGM